MKRVLKEPDNWQKQIGERKREKNNQSPYSENFHPAGKVPSNKGFFLQ